MPTPKQFEKIAAEAERRIASTPGPAPADQMPDELWTSLLTDPRAAEKPKPPIQQFCLADKLHFLDTERLHFSA